MNKKLIAILLALTAAGSLSFGLTACGSNNGVNTGANTEQNGGNSGNNSSSSNSGNGNNSNTEQGDNSNENSGNGGQGGDESGSVAYSEGLEYTLSEDESYYIASGLGTCEDSEIYISPVYNGNNALLLAYGKGKKRRAERYRRAAIF